MPDQAGQTRATRERSAGTGPGGHYAAGVTRLGKYLTADDVERMTSKLYLTRGEDRGRKLSAYWVLLLLAAVIASAGVLADSVATVIGAMIVAPLMTPILGTALALVLADRRQLLDGVLLVVAGSLAVVAVGYLLGLVHVGEVVADTNSQVAGRVSPGLLDLTAALATGAVGAFALVRSDVSDTLPGVAIAISLVPPLAVVGLTLESGAPREARGALLLFLTNVTAIIATGTVVLLASRVRRVLARAGHPVPRLSVGTLVTLVAAGFVVSVPLAVGTVLSTLNQVIAGQSRPAVEDWSARRGLEVQDLSVVQGDVVVVVVGRATEADMTQFRAALDRAGLQQVDAKVTVLPGETYDLAGE